MAESSAGLLSPLAPMMAPMTALQGAPSWRGAPPAPPRAPDADPQRRPPGWAFETLEAPGVRGPWWGRTFRVWKRGFQVLLVGFLMGFQDFLMGFRWVLIDGWLAFVVVLGQEEGQ